MPFRIRLTGGITIHRYPEIRATFGDAEASGQSVVIDLREVPHADSVFLSELLLLRRRVTTKSRRFAAIIGEGHVLRVLSLARLTEKLELFPDEAAALAYLGPDDESADQSHGEGETSIRPG